MLDGFWSATFWLPEKVSWDDLDSFEADGNQISRAKDLLIVPLYAAVLLVARFMFEITIGNWTAAFLNIKVIGLLLCMNLHRIYSGYQENYSRKK